jgi:hypothetical protein
MHLHVLWSHGAGRRCSASLVVLLALLCGCSHTQQVDTARLDQTGMWSGSVAELQTFHVSNAEITELAKAHQAGLSDPSCIELIKLARSRQKPFSDGQPIADLLGAGFSEAFVLNLAHLDQLGLWAGQARVLRLAGLPDKVILATAQRQSQGLTVLSGNTLGELKNAGVSDVAILDLVQKGTSEQQAAAYISQREQAGGHGFVSLRHRRRSR